MAITSYQKKISEKRIKTSSSTIDSVNVLSEHTKRDIEKSYNLDTFKGMEAYFSNRYGWILRRTED